MESAFVDDIVVIFDPFLRFSPVFCPCLFSDEDLGFVLPMTPCWRS
jgi:hypothetical protein